MKLDNVVVYGRAGAGPVLAAACGLADRRHGGAGSNVQYLLVRALAAMGLVYIDIGPVDLMCRDPGGGWVAVEIKRVATIEAVEQLSRYLERLRADPSLADCRGILAAQRFRPQATTLAGSRGLACAEVDLASLRGDRGTLATLRHDAPLADPSHRPRAGSG